MPTAIIFDCDGVLFDSWRANVAYYNAIRAAMALSPMDPEWERRAHFLAASQVFTEMFGASAPLLDHARRVASTVDYEPFYDLMVPASGLHEVLAVLRRDHKLAMASNRSSTVPEIVRRFGLGHWFETAVGAHDVPRPKPAPDMLELVLRRLGVAPSAAVYVGDAESDLAAATAAGVHFVGIGEPGWSPFSIRALDELPAMLRRVPLDRV